MLEKKRKCCRPLGQVRAAQIASQPLQLIAQHRNAPVTQQVAQVVVVRRWGGSGTCFAKRMATPKALADPGGVVKVDEHPLAAAVWQHAAVAHDVGPAHVVVAKPCAAV